MWMTWSNDIDVLVHPISAFWHTCTNLRRLPRIGLFGGGIQFASLISASSRRLAAIVENFARVSGVILFIVEKARAACSSPFFRSFWAVVMLAFGSDALAADADTDGADGGLAFAVRQCLSYRIENKTIKYSISARNTKSVHDMSHTCKYEIYKLISEHLSLSNSRYVTYFIIRFLPRGTSIRVHPANCCAPCQTLWPTTEVLSPKVPEIIMTISMRWQVGREHVSFMVRASAYSPFDREQFLARRQNFPTISTRKASTANSFQANSFSLHAIMWFQDVPNSAQHRRNLLCAVLFP